MTIESITQNELLELFEYRDGVLYWKINTKRMKAGDVAGRTVKDGYRQMCINGCRPLLHQVVFKMFYGYIPKLIDHIDKNTTNNRIENLRPATKSQNRYNSKLNSNNKSGIKGVYWHKSFNKWIARASVNGKQKYLGCFDDLELADLVAQEARDKYHGAFANHG